MFQIVRHWFHLEVLFRPLRPRKRRAARRLNFHQQFERPQFQQLESRDMLFGFMQAQDEGPFKVLNCDTYLNFTRRSQFISGAMSLLGMLIGVGSP